MLKLIENSKNYWEFIRKVRNDEKNQHGFVEKVVITPEQQEKYMEKHNNEYYVCVDSVLVNRKTMLGNVNILEDNPVGFVGCVDNDIRIAVDSTTQRKGVGTFMLQEFVKNFIDPIKDVAKVKHDNEGSHRLFIKCGFTVFREDDNFKYYKVYEL